MYRKVSWWKPADDDIIRMLGPPQELELSTSDLAHNVGISAPYVRERMREALLESGLVVRVESEGSRNRFAITELGRKYCREELSPEFLEELVPDSEE